VDLFSDALSVTLALICFAALAALVAGLDRV
jgi:flagellar biosynthesis protein FliQ